MAPLALLARVPGPEPRPGRALLLLWLSALLLAAVSWGRFLILGEIAPDAAPLPVALRAPVVGLLAVALVVAGLAHRLLVRQAPRLGPDRLLLFAVIVTVAASAMLPLLSNDLFSVLAYVDLARDTTVDPFVLPLPGLRASRFYAEVSPFWRWAPCVYGPVQLAFWSAALAEDVLAAVGRAKVLALLAALGVALLLHLHTRGRGPRGRTRFALVALSPVLWIEGAGQAHGDLLAALFVAAWLPMASRGWWFAASVAMGLALASKLTVALPAALYVVYLLGRGRWSALRRVATAAGAALVTGAVVVAAYWPVWRDAWTIRRPLRALGARWPFNTPAEALFQLGVGLGLPERGLLVPLNDACSALAVAIGLAAVVAAFRARRVRQLAAAAAAASFLAATLAAPVFHPWYLLPALVLAVELRGAAWRRWLLLAGWGTVLLDLPVLLPIGTVGHVSLRVLTLGMACFLAVWSLGSRLAPLRQAPTAGSARRRRQGPGGGGPVADGGGQTTRTTSP